MASNPEEWLNYHWTTRLERPQNHWKKVGIDLKKWFQLTLVSIVIVVGIIALVTAGDKQIELHEELSQRDVEINTLKEQLAELKEDHVLLANKVDTQREKIAQISANLSKQEAYSSYLQATLSARDSSLNQLDSLNNHLQTDLTNLSKAAADLSAAIEEAKSSEVKTFANFSATSLPTAPESP